MICDGILTERIWIMVITKGEMKGGSGGAKLLDSLTPGYNGVVSKVGIASGPLSTLEEVIDFRKLELHASLCGGRDAGREPYMARFLG